MILENGNISLTHPYCEKSSRFIAQLKQNQQQQLIANLSFGHNTDASNSSNGAIITGMFFLKQCGIKCFKQGHNADTCHCYWMWH